MQENAAHQGFIENLRDGTVEQIEYHNRHYGKCNVEIYVKISAEDAEDDHKLDHDGRYGVTHEVKNAISDQVIEHRICGTHRPAFEIGAKNTTLEETTGVEKSPSAEHCGDEAAYHNIGEVTLVIVFQRCYAYCAKHITDEKPTEQA